MNEKDIEEKAEQFEAALEGLMCAMEELRKDRDRLKKLAERPRGWFIEEVIPYEGRRTITCSECGKELSTGPEVGVNYFRRGWRYCPYCGAQMGAEEEE